MKRVFLLITALVFSSGVFAQEYNRAIGLRIGSSVGASYRQFLEPTRALEAILDLDIIGKENLKIKGSAFYQFNFDIGLDGFSLYAGPGASAGLYIGSNSGFLLAIDGIAGVEYKFFNLPLALSFDWNPKVQIITDSGFKPYNFGLTLRYTL